MRQEEKNIQSDSTSVFLFFFFILRTGSSIVEIVSFTCHLKLRPGKKKIKKTMKIKYKSQNTELITRGTCFTSKN